jgi:hypothetical protein
VRGAGSSSWTGIFEPFPLFVGTDWPYDRLIHFARRRRYEHIAKAADPTVSRAM